MLLYGRVPMFKINSKSCVKTIGSYRYVYYTNRWMDYILNIILFFSDADTRSNNMDSISKRSVYMYWYLFLCLSWLMFWILCVVSLSGQLISFWISLIICKGLFWFPFLRCDRRKGRQTSMVQREITKALNKLW